MRITPIDDTRANEGTWTSYMGVRLKIARANNDSFKKIFRRLSKPYSRDLENDNVDEKVAEEILAKSIAHAILVDWDADTFPDKIEYTEDQARDLMINDPDCRDFVMEFARQRENFYLEELEERVGNS